MATFEQSHESILSAEQRAFRYGKAITAVRDYAVCLLDANGVIIDWNPAAELIKGYPASEALGRHFGMLYTDEAKAEGRPEANLKVAAEYGAFQEEAWRVRKSGEKYWAHVEIIAFYDDATCQVSGFCKITQDLTQRQILEDRLLLVQQDMQRILEAAYAATWQWNCDSDVVTVSPTLIGALGYQAEEMPTSRREWDELVHPDDRETLQRALRSYWLTDVSQPSCEFRMRAKDGTYRWFLTRPSWRATTNGGTSPVVTGIMVDIHGKKEAELAREELMSQIQFEKERALVTLSSIGDAVISTDNRGLIIEFNATAERLTGWSAAEAIGRSIGDVLNVVEDESNRPLSDFIISCLKFGRTTNMSPRAVLRSRSGGVLSVEDVAAPIRMPNGDIRGLVIVFRDVTESRRMVQNLAYQATHDPLTGLANRAEFETRIQRALDNAINFKTESALLFMDLDQFKIVNDTCGHKAGDELLRQLSQLFRAHVRERDTLARLGGDEFALLIEHCTIDEALRVANKVLATTRVFHFPFGGRTFHVGISIGLVAITAASQSPQSIMQRADHACYTAKDAGRNRVHIQQQGDEQLAQRQTDMDWASRIGQALHDHAFQLFYQTIVPIANEGGFHYEVLLRMNDGRGGWTLPGMFLPSAERYDMMPAIDRWVLGHTVTWLEHHPEHAAKLDWCTINLSARSLGDERFQEFAINLLNNAQVPTEKLCFEITETAAIADLGKTIRFIEELKRTGCRFALDDFGTGMASFSYLKNLPVDFIKIDGSFVSAIHESQADAEMVRSINQIGHLMGKKTVAEGVADESTMQLLSVFGVDFVQGFWIAKPQPFLD